ncbi:MAG TPA: FAD-dependent oxidoreductase [Amycolatopsis sp.]|uniref:NAD(P)/FAD-dependent oxidoreductase n=1 Tax=Amycolatopsis sp. TaxID=37632 RepID=UPI002B495781|nr:FAD-dependent oxidoreductase [Amycolatopsis sp.]HKS45181.1 FAD-dependent oxidoreductase [Amycolatopsis sp.]
MKSPEHIAVVGAGLAGLRAAERLRELGFHGELTIIGAEKHKPYHRPALSKQFLEGGLRGRDLMLPSYFDLDAEWRLGTPVQRLDPARRVLYLPGEPPVRYDGLVIATGVRSRALPGAPLRDPRVHMLRTIDDATALHRSLAASDLPCLIIGGGFTACELASTLRDLGRDVVLVSRSKTLLRGAFDPVMGEAITGLHRSKGVDVQLGAQVRHWAPAERGVGAYLSTGKFVVAGCVVLAVGGEPETDWLYGAGLDISDGVLCEPTCHVVGASDVVAAGDMARWPNRRFGSTPRRIEHWLNAMEMGRAAAESLLAGRAAAVPFEPMPRFWSEQYGVRLQAAGMPRLGRRVVRLSGDARTGAGVLGYFADDLLVGVVGRESPRAMLHWAAKLRASLTPAAAAAATRRRIWRAWRQTTCTAEGATA